MHLHPFETLRRHRGTVVVDDGACMRVLNAALNHSALAHDTTVWQAPEVVAWPALLGRYFEHELLRGVAGEAVDFVLSPDQELALWQHVIAADDTLDASVPEQIAPLAQDAWRLLHTWALPWHGGSFAMANDDVAAFTRWARAYVERCTQLRVTDYGRLLVDAARRGWQLGASVLAQGMLDPSPVVARLLAGLPTADCVAPGAGAVTAFSGRAYAERDQELHAAFVWAQTIHARDPAARVVIALEGLQQEQDRVRRCRDAVFAAPTAVFMSAREPLARHPRIRAALQILELAPVMRWDHLSDFIRSPSVVGAATERSERALFDAELRKLKRFEMPLTVVLEALVARTRPLPQLAAVLQDLVVLHAERPRRQTLMQWLAHFERCLAVAGWPGVEPAEAVPAGLMQDWAEVCDRLQRLDAVLPAVSAGDALSRLRRLLARSGERASASAAGIFVVTPAQAGVLAPTHLWLAGCESEALMARSRPSPLLPSALQRAVGVPGADAGRDLDRARQLLAVLAGDGRDRVCSYRVGDGETTFSPSPLLPVLRQAAAVPVTRFVPVGWRLAPAPITLLADDYGPAMDGAGGLAGGVAVLAAQAACPFRAFARHRLGGRALDEPRPGLDKQEQGSAVHRVLAALWLRVRDHASLVALDSRTRERLLRDVIARALRLRPDSTPLEREIHTLERERLAVLLDAWLTFEAARAPFTVIAVERAATVAFADLELGIRIDRVDRLADGSQVIIDYKTGRSQASDWQPPRMNEPQLPFYAVVQAAAETTAIAFAQIERERPRWISSAASGEEWPLLLARWQDDLSQLVEEIQRGAARVEPKYGAQTCRLCDLQLFCRIAENQRVTDDDEAVDVE